MEQNDSKNSFYDLFEVDSVADDAIGDVDADTHPRYVSHDVSIVPQSSPASAAPPQTNINRELASSTKSPAVKASANSKNIDVLKLPAIKPRNTTRKTKKQMKLVSADRTAVIVWPDISILLSDLLRWAKVTPDICLGKATLNAYPKAMSDRFLIGREPLCRRESVDQADFDYNFVVPLELVRTMERVLMEEKRHD
ncbi:hypothetical protein AM587_10012186 [Phytophthora nicotianae]|uniref:Uncharacterized protein n=2 Tax=Phytophthora nicotianae TaxID=4792 RepID=V9F8K5_PHYNI|nr:hypothetical protein F443_08089 [Phytophthora nicotianae P1569]KUF77825.1 hypothetical protein AM587_10012186 [Phytophthora nicotianae]